MNTHPHTHLFTQVDRTKDPDFFVRFMDEAQKPPAIQASKRLILERLALLPGEAVLDVGCGPGADVFEMVDTLGPAGRLVGLDASSVMIVSARRRARDLHVPITFEIGEAQALPFPDGTFDVCRAERLMGYLPAAERELAQMVRVTRPGGRILVFAFDWDTLIIDHPDKETTRTIVLSSSDSMRNGWIGRQLPRLFKRQHLEVLSLDPVPIFVPSALAELFLGSRLTVLQTNGTLSARRAKLWWEDLQRADADPATRDQHGHGGNRNDGHQPCKVPEKQETFRLLHILGEKDRFSLLENRSSCSQRESNLTDKLIIHQEWV